MTREKDSEGLLCEGATSVYGVFNPLIVAIFALIALSFVYMSIRIVFNQVPANSSMIFKVRRAARVYKVTCDPCIVGNRIKFSHAALDGQSIQEFDPKEKGTDEINVL